MRAAYAHKHTGMLLPGKLYKKLALLLTNSPPPICDGVANDHRRLSRVQSVELTSSSMQDDAGSDGSLRPDARRASYSRVGCQGTLSSAVH